MLMHWTELTKSPSHRLSCQMLKCVQNNWKMPFAEPPAAAPPASCQSHWGCALIGRSKLFTRCSLAVPTRPPLLKPHPSLGTGSLFDIACQVSGGSIKPEAGELEICGSSIWTKAPMDGRAERSNTWRITTGPESHQVQLLAPSSPPVADRSRCVFSPQWPTVLRCGCVNDECLLALHLSRSNAGPTLRRRVSPLRILQPRRVTAFCDQCS